MLVEPLYLGRDGWFHRCDTLDVAKPIACPIPGETSPKKEDKLSLFRLGLEWRFYKSFSPKRMKAADGTLTLQAQGIDPASSSPLLFISGRHRFQIEAEIELYGDVTAGFVLFKDETNTDGGPAPLREPRRRRPDEARLYRRGRHVREIVSVSAYKKRGRL